MFREKSLALLAPMGLTLFVCFWLSQALASLRSYDRVMGLTSVRFIDNRLGWISGTKGIYHTKDGGLSWERKDAVVIRESDKSTHYLVDRAGRLLWADKERALVTSDDGILSCASGATDCTLTRPEQLKMQDFTDLAFVNDRSGWAVDNKRVYLTFDGGKSWQTRGASTKEGFISLSALSETEVWVMGYASLLMHTDDGGKTWTSKTVRCYRCYLERIEFVTRTKGWIFGGAKPKVTNDGGQTWTDREFPPNTGLFDLSFSDQRRGWIVGDATIFRTDNGGQSWVVDLRNVHDYITGVAALPNGNVWAVTRKGTVFQYTLGRNTWTRESLELDWSKIRKLIQN